MFFFKRRKLKKESLRQMKLLQIESLINAKQIKNIDDFNIYKENLIEKLGEIYKNIQINQLLVDKNIETEIIKTSNLITSRLKKIYNYFLNHMNDEMPMKGIVDYLLTDLPSNFNS